MSTTRRPYFIISALPADDMAQQDLEVEQVFHLKAEEARDEVEKMKKSLNDNGFDFEWRLGCKETLDKLDEAEHVDGIIFGFGLRGHPAPSISILFEELIEKVRYHPKNVKMFFNWSIPSSLDACQRAMKLKADKEKEAAGVA
ncbi:hypothetical protein N8I77_002594 [Diaporthe amygdali]|uniref:Uncharacterized protein n=1 Tax=Phomopsis amygdali TaxID=1214568 RepID=A0AAD9W9F1_PHOAM|nr:hypothetical protein N8I77_002594 [Diaporthe amygdali]